MFQKFELKKFPLIDSLHDCSTSSIKLIDNELIINFDKEGLDILLPNGSKMYPYEQLKLTYILVKDINYNESNDCSVRQINERERLIRKAIKQWSLIEFVNFINENERNLRFFAQYYNQGKCIILSELISKRDWQMGNWFEIELSVDEIIFETVETD